MTLRIEDLNRTLYASIAEYNQDLQHAGNDGAVIDAISAKLTRSWPTLRGTQGAQTVSPGSPRTHRRHHLRQPDARGYTCGTASNDRQNATAEASAEMRTGLTGFRKVQVINKR